MTYKLANCFENTALAILTEGKQGTQTHKTLDLFRHLEAVVVHGYVTNNSPELKGVRMSHAWVEFTINGTTICALT